MRRQSRRWGGQVYHKQYHTEEDNLGDEEDNLGDEEDNLGDEEDKFITNNTRLRKTI